MLAGTVAFLTFITLMGAGLISAVCAAYWRHQYKMWDVKARVADTAMESTTREQRSSRHLKLMRRSMLVALLTFALGLVELLGFVDASLSHRRALLIGESSPTTREPACGAIDGGLP
jgi:ABC-type enterochelin transport system permease subunit